MFATAVEKKPQEVFSDLRGIGREEDRDCQTVKLTSVRDVGGGGKEFQDKRDRRIR